MEPSTVMLLPKLSENYICLMCVDSFHSKNEFFNHLGIEHDFLNFLHHKNQSFISTQFDWIRFVNYVRRNKPHDLRQAFYDGEWKTDSLELLYPVLSDDEVLSIDILDFQMRTTATPAPTTISNNSNSNGHEDDITILSPNSHIANYLCLICSCRLASTTEFFLHLTLKHDCLNFLDGKYHSVFSDHFNWIRFVNYVRRNVSRIC
ncbi:unnamed protein product [Trichobilharzia regenti]|nr:unnamed protein product [Trichobilharzia regenti]